MKNYEADDAVIDRMMLLRKTLKLSQYQLGQAVGVSDTTIRNYENRRSHPSLNCLNKICDIYNVNRDWLFDGKGDMLTTTVAPLSSIGDRLLMIRNREGLSQDAFGPSIGLSGSGYGNIERGIINATDRVIKDICRVYGVAEQWLRTGEGEMYEDHTEEQEFAAQLAELLADEPKSFRKRMISALIRLNDDQVDMIEKILDDIYNPN